MSHMSLANVTTGRVQRPLKISLYGVDGVGKTSFAAGSPNPVFIATEDGTHHVDVARFPVPRTWLDLVGPEGAISYLYSGDHNYQTVVVDSGDWAESLCDQYLVERYMQETNKQIDTVTDIPYGGWKARKVVEFGKLLDYLSILVRERGMHVILISHTNIKRFDDPEREAYERYEIKLFSENAAKVREWSDYNLFINYDTHLATKGEGFHERQIGASHGKRLLLSRRRAAYDAKARYPIPERLTLPDDPTQMWPTFWQAHMNASAFNQQLEAQ